MSIVATAFLAQARAISSALSEEPLPLAEYPGVVMIDSDGVFRQKVLGMVDSIVTAFSGR